MKVRELQEKLGVLDPDLDVVCYSEYDKLLPDGRGFILFDILAVSTSKAERIRLEDRTPYLKFGEGPASEAIATLELTVDF